MKYLLSYEWKILGHDWIAGIEVIDDIADWVNHINSLDAGYMGDKKRIEEFKILALIPIGEEQAHKLGDTDRIVTVTD